MGDNSILREWRSHIGVVLIKYGAKCLNGLGEYEVTSLSTRQYTIFECIHTVAI